MDWETLILIITLILMTISFVIIIVPSLPGTVFIWATATFYGLVLGWENLGWTTFIILTILMAIGIIIEVLAGHVGAKVGGASWEAIVVGMIAAVIFGFFPAMIGLGPLGCVSGIIGMVAGIMGVEYYRNDDWEKALQATQGYCAGATAGMVAKLVTGAMMFVVFLIRVFFMEF